MNTEFRDSYVRSIINQFMELYDVYDNPELFVNALLNFLSMMGIAARIPPETFKEMLDDVNRQYSIAYEEHKEDMNED